MRIRGIPMPVNHTPRTPGRQVEFRKKGVLSLGRKLFAFLGFNLVLVLGLVGGTAYLKGKGLIETSTRRGIDQQTVSIGRIASYAVFVEDRVELARILGLQLKEPDIVYLAARNEAGEILLLLSDPGWEEEGRTATSRQPVGSERQFRTFLNDRETRYVEGFIPIHLESEPSFENEASPMVAGPERVGWIQVGFDTTWMTRQWEGFRRNLLLLCGVLSALYAGCALIFVRRIVRPIGSLVQATRRLGEGGFDSRVHIRSRDEVGELAASFNQMASSLQTAQEEIREHNRELERKVEERTRELQVAKENLESAYQDLKNLDKMKDSFLSSVSHELRTPLTSIRSFSEILLQYEDTDAKTQTEFLTIINSESERLTRLINDVLDLSRIEARRMIWHDDLLSMREMIEEVVRSHQSLLGEKFLTISVDAPDSLPLVFADRDRITQVLTNLLGNAMKFSSPGGRIELYAEVFEGRRFGETSPWVKIRVRDEGVGIDKADHEFIFDKFSQVAGDTLTDRPKGTGLGLPICKEIVSHYGGNIWVESQKGEGASFYFTLPGTSLRGEAEANKPAEPVETTSEEDGGWRRKTVLVVDDNPNMRRLLRHHFETRGYTIVEAADGHEALKKARTHRVDLITLDLMMPAMSGYDLLGMLREDPLTRDIPILIISVVEDNQTGILMGANDCLKKPFLEKELMDKVRQLLGGNKRRSVLVVDDDGGVREGLRLQLEDLGYSAWTAADGEAAIEQLLQRRPDLVILDVIMPRKNGPEVLQWIRNNPGTQDLPVIILTAHSLLGDQVRMMTLGIDGYVEKAQGLERLFQSVDTLLHQNPN
ncbi:MAG: response regulator [bacterium]